MLTGLRQCPLEINLTDAAPGSAWSCEVRLQRGYEYTSDQSHHEGSRFERFRRLALPQDVLFRQVGRKEDLCDVLQKAQAEILAPATGGALRHTSTVSDLKFSPNIIRIHVCGRLLNLQMTTDRAPLDIRARPATALLLRPAGRHQPDRERKSIMFYTMVGDFSDR